VHQVNASSRDTTEKISKLEKRLAALEAAQKAAAVTEPAKSEAKEPAAEQDKEKEKH
jgi:BMFP domain-containing protein YqiC